MVAMATHNSVRVMKPIILVAHPNPRLGWRPRKVIGYTIPPILLPPTAIPVAMALLVLKYVDTTAILGTNRHPVPRPRQIPCAKTTCQYFVQILVIMIARTVMKLPMSSNELR